MKKYIFKRLLHLLWIMLAVSFFTFLLIYISPGDAATKKLYSHGVVVTEEALQQTREEMGLVRPFFIQYGDWALSALKGDLGKSFKDDMSVFDKMLKGMRHTFILTAASLLIALVVSLPLSIFTAIKKDSVLDYVVRFLSFVGNSLPNFLIAVLLMYFLCVKARLLPVIAEGTFKGLLLPCLALSIPLCGRFLCQFRAEILEQLSCEYVSGSAARGVKAHYILFKNV
ncbi:MAG: ABC transporter permease, partial [Clostridia bacterium]|nr:ABC transporter permease [Clostridia bacterium]